jgi:hypothetical protein
VLKADDGDGVHACVGPTSSTRAGGGALSSDPVSCISLLNTKLL